MKSFSELFTNNFFEYCWVRFFAHQTIIFLCFYGKRRQFHNWKTICIHIFPRTTRLWIKGTALLFSFWQYHHKCLLHGLAVKDHKILWYLLDFLPLWITICNYIHTFFQEFLSLECKVQLWYFYFCNIITSVVCMAFERANWREIYFKIDRLSFW